jgi:hypothetical protein
LRYAQLLEFGFAELLIPASILVNVFGLTAHPDDFVGLFFCHSPLDFFDFL